MQEDSDHETYTATLTARSLRVMISIAAKWDLELKQYDVQNAFTNSNMDEDLGRACHKGIGRRASVGSSRRPSMALKPLLFYDIDY